MGYYEGSLSGLALGSERVIIIRVQPRLLGDLLRKYEGYKGSVRGLLGDLARLEPSSEKGSGYFRGLRPFRLLGFRLKKSLFEGLGVSRLGLGVQLLFS